MRESGGEESKVEVYRKVLSIFPIKCTFHLRVGMFFTYKHLN